MSQELVSQYYLKPVIEESVSFLRLEAVLIDNEPRVNSKEIALHLGIEHESLVRLITNHKPRLEVLGILRFEIGKIENAVRGRPSELFFLNEDQSYLLLTLVRNTPESVALKLGLVVAFKAAREALAKLSAPLSDPMEILRVTFEALQNQRAEVTALKAQTQALERRTQSLHFRPDLALEVVINIATEDMPPGSAAFLSSRPWPFSTGKAQRVGEEAA